MQWTKRINNNKKVAKSGRKNVFISKDKEAHLLQPHYIIFAKNMPSILHLLYAIYIYMLQLLILKIIVDQEDRTEKMFMLKMEHFILQQKINFWNLKQE